MSILRLGDTVRVLLPQYGQPSTGTAVAFHQDLVEVQDHYGRRHYVSWRNLTKAAT